MDHSRKTVMTTGTLTQSIARGYADKALAEAEKLGITVSVAILDAGGHLMHFARHDGASLITIDVAIRKARTSVMFAMPSGDLAAGVLPGGPVYGVDAGGQFAPFAGGLRILETDGPAIGAIGVSGGLVDEDETVARAAIS